jgi:hypothetical protein
MPNTIRVDFNHTEGGDPGLANRTFWHYTGAAPSNGDLSTLAGLVAGYWNSAIAPLAVSAVNLIEIVCTDLTSPTAGRGTWTGSHAGTSAAFPLPDNSCVCLNFQIARRYRGGKPRMYAPWGGTSNVAADYRTWLPAFQTSVNTAWTTFANDLNSLAFGGTTLQNQVNVSYYSGVDPPHTLDSGRVKQSSKVRSAADGNVILPDSIVGHTCNKFIGSQRRRIRATGG